MLQFVSDRKDFEFVEQRTTKQDSVEFAEWTRNAKRALRNKLRALREALPPSAANARSQRIVKRLNGHPRIVEARSIALFWPMLDRREVDLRAFDSALRERGMVIYYPFMSRNGANDDITTGFRRVDSIDEMTAQGQRFAQPTPSAPIAERGEVDIVIVPALGLTPDGHRLGYGAGFYDATLLDICPPAFSIVVAYDFQLMLELPLEAHDIACDAVITDRD